MSNDQTKTIQDPSAHHTSSRALIRRFLPYLAKYKGVLFFDLFCAALTTLCDIILPKIMSTITNSAMGVGITLTAGIVLRLAALYLTTCFCWTTPTTTTPRSAPSWAASPTTCST